jgi:hypothetical protein
MYRIYGENMSVTFFDLLAASGLSSALTFLLTLWITERLRASLQKENNEYLEKLKWEQKTREQSVRAATYLAHVRDLREDDCRETYIKANELGWELAMWLPDDLYRSLTQALVYPDKRKNVLSVVVEIRQALLGKAAGSLSADEIMFHAPGAGQFLTARKQD